MVLKKTLDLRQLHEHFRVAIFGSARIRKGDRLYKTIYDLAKEIAKENIDVVTGGGPGIMDAANRGHHAGRKNGNHSLSFGLLIHMPREQKQSRHLDIKKEFYRFSGRLDHFVKLSNVVVVAPGGVGTMLELMYVWQLVQVRQTCNIPIILLDPMWKGLLKWMKNHPVRKGYIDQPEFDLLFPAKNVRQAIHIIKAANKAYQENSKNVCRSINRYAIYKTK